MSSLDPLNKEINSHINPLSPLLLRQWILNFLSPQSGKKFVIIDVRDRDYKYAKITGSYNYPSRSFNEIICDKIVRNYPEKDYVYVFHCMRSENRGPRCARFFVKYQLNKFRDEDTDGKFEVYVLQQGFKGWFQLFEDCNDLIEPV